MLEFSGDGHNAVLAGSRLPLRSVIVESPANSFSEISGISLPLSVHRLQDYDSYYLATGYTVPSRTTIQYKRMTSIDLSSDWNTGWSNLVTVSEGFYHDMIMSGANATVIYRTGDNGVSSKDSSDYGNSWGSATAFPSLPGTPDYVVGLALADLNTAYIVGWWTAVQCYVWRYTRSAPGNAWSLSSTWTNGGEYWLPAAMTSPASNAQFFARQLSDGSDLLIFNAIKGLSDAEGMWYWPFVCKYNDGLWEPVYPALGGVEANYDYRYMLHGLSRGINGYYFAAICESYGKRADVRGLTTDDQLYFARTDDGRGYAMLPTSASSPETIYIAGAAVDGNYVYVPASTISAVGTVYKCPYGSWWGAGWWLAYTTVTDDIVGPISISSSVRAAAKSNLVLTNIDGTYTNHSVVKPGSLCRVKAGYATAVGSEIQNRFVGELWNQAETAGADKTISYEMYDLLVRANRKVNRPYFVVGQNVFYEDFGSVLDIDKFIVQNGTWAVTSGRLQNTMTGDHAFILAGTEPFEAYAVAAKIRFGTAITDNIGGLFIYSDSSAGYVYMLLYEKSTNKLYIRRGNYTTGAITTIATSTNTYTWSADTDYWLMAFYRYGYSYCFVSTDGIVWSPIAGLSGIDCTSVSGYGYVGAYCYLDSAGTFSIDDFRVFSALKPNSDSDVMKHLAAVSNLMTDEVMEIDDDFPGSAFSSRWSTYVDGTWTVSGGQAHGAKSGSDPTVIRTNIYADDIIVQQDLAVSSSNAGAGIMVRGGAALAQCYAAFVSTTNTIIGKKVGGSWSTLFSVSSSFTGTVRMIFAARGPYLSVFINGTLMAFVYDEALTEGYVGLVSDVSTGDSDHDNFLVDGFYKPRDVVTMKPNDTPAGVMAQIADLYDGGQFFCNAFGELTWGIFDHTTADLDVRAITLDMSTGKKIDKLLTIARVVGDNAYGEARDLSWATELSTHLRTEESNKLLTTGRQCLNAAEEILDESSRVTEETVTIRGYPALEPCDVVGTAKVPTDSAQPRRILGFSETIDVGTYETTLGDLENVSEETP